MITVLHNQSLLDLAIQEYGTADAVVALAMANGLSVSDTLIPGQKLLGIALEGDAEIVRYYRGKNIRPATAQSIQPGALPGEPGTDPESPEEQKDGCDLCQFFH